MPATLSPAPKLQFFTAAGVPLVGGKLYSYQAGTTTPLATYTSQSGATANTNPIILDSRGEANVWLGVASYKLALYTAADVLVWTVDNVDNVDSGDGFATLAQLAASGGSSLIGYLPAGTGAVATTVQAKLRQYITPEDFGAAGNGTTDDTGAVQAAITALTAGQTLRLIGDYKITGTGLTITNKSRITIVGPGRLKLVGAAVDAVILKLVGTCDEIRIVGVRMEGDGNSGATYFQYGIWNASGQTLSNVWVAWCQFKNLNAGISFNADSGGTYTNAFALNNVCEDMVGTLGGQGYGIFCSKVTNCHIVGNTILRAQRHSIYAARGSVTPGDDYGVMIHGNVIRDHRSVGFSSLQRAAIYCVRGYGYSIKNNKIINYRDGGIGVSHDTVDLTSDGDSLVSGNELFDRRNAVPSLWVGESANPTSYRTRNVRVSDNIFCSDISVGGYTQEISVFNGLGVDVTSNYFNISNIPNISYRPITVGEYAAQGALDLDLVNVLRNTFNGSLSGSGYLPVRLVYCATPICSVPAGGAARVRVADNEVNNLLLSSSIEFQSGPTNKKLVCRDQWGGIAGTYTAADTTPSVFGGVTYLFVSNAAAVNVTSLTDWAPQQVTTLVFGDANTTIKHATGNIRLVGGVDFVSSSRDTLTLIYSPVYAQWLEVGRAVVA